MGNAPGGREVAAASRPAAVVRSGAAGWIGLTLGLARRAVVSPRLARDLFVVLWRFRRRRWFLRPPFLPLPSREYVRWRMYTAYGDERAVPPVADMIRYAHWAGRSR